MSLGRVHKGLRPVVRAAIAAGFTLTLGRKHLKLHSPAGRLVAVLPHGRKTKDGRHMAQTAARIRREVRHDEEAQ